MKSINEIQINTCVIEIRDRNYPPLCIRPMITNKIRVSRCKLTTHSCCCYKTLIWKWWASMNEIYIFAIKASYRSFLYLVPAHLCENRNWAFLLLGLMKCFTRKCSKTLMKLEIFLLLLLRLIFPKIPHHLLVNGLRGS